MDLQKLNNLLADRYFRALGELEEEINFDDVPIGISLPTMSETALFISNPYGLDVWDDETFAWNRGFAWCLLYVAREMGLDPKAWQPRVINPSTGEPWKQGTRAISEEVGP